jgi:hypothetical protein
MAAHPKAKQTRPPHDRTSLVVGAGVVFLALTGVGTIFADPIVAAFSPSPAPASVAATAAAPTDGDTASATVELGRPVDGGHS